MSQRLLMAIACVFALTALIAAPHALSAQEESSDEEEVENEDPWVAKWSNGFKIEQGDSFKLKFGGRIQADYTFADADETLEAEFGADNFENGFEFRRARLFVEGTIYDRVKFKAQYDFAGGDANFRDVWIGLVQNFGEIRFGHYKEYFSLQEMTSSKYLALLERSLPVLAFSPSYNAGIGAHGSREDQLNWGVGAFYDADDFGTSTDEDNVNLTGRIGYRPFYQDGGKRLLHVGLGVTHRNRANDIRFRARPENHLTTRLVDTGTFVADSALILGVEVAGVHDRFWYSGEYMQADVDSTAAGDPTFDGAYVQAGYFLTNDHRRFKTSSGAFDRQKPNQPWDKSGGKGAWEAVIRLSTLDLSDGAINGGEQDDLTLGLNWYPNPATRFMLNFINADVEGLGDARFVALRVQVDF